MSMYPPPPQDPSYTGAGYPSTSPSYASWGKRVAAFLIDALIGAAIIIVGAILGTLIASASRGLGSLIVVISYVGGFGFQIWNWIVQGSTGQTIGKRAIGTRLVRLDNGQAVGAAVSVGRGFLHILDGLPCYLGYLWPLWDPRHQTFADKIVGSVVINA